MSLNTKRPAVAAVGLLTIFVLIGLCYSTPKIIAAPRQARSKSNARADDLFKTNCARCHGADGRGDTPDFTDSEWWQKHSDITSTRSLVSIVTKGKGGMPGFGKKLKNSDIKLLVNYVRRFRPAR
jgi:mono/diheme cytochrome c family protein